MRTSPVRQPARTRSASMPLPRLNEGREGSLHPGVAVGHQRLRLWEGQASAGGEDLGDGLPVHEGPEAKGDAVSPLSNEAVVRGRAVNRASRRTNVSVTLHNDNSGCHVWHYVAWCRPTNVARAALARRGVRRSRMVDAPRNCGENGWNVRTPARAAAGEASLNPTRGAPE